MRSCAFLHARCGAAYYAFSGGATYSGVIGSSRSSVSYECLPCSSRLLLAWGHPRALPTSSLHGLLNHFDHHLRHEVGRVIACYRAVRLSAVPPEVILLLVLISVDISRLAVRDIVLLDRLHRRPSSVE